MRLMRINWFHLRPKCISLFFAPEPGRVFSQSNKKMSCATGAENQEGETEVRYS